MWDRPDPGIEPVSPALTGRLRHQGSPCTLLIPGILLTRFYSFHSPQSKGPLLPDLGPLPVSHLLRTRLHRMRWAASGWTGRQVSEASLLCHCPSFTLPPEPFPPKPPWQNLSSTELVPGAKKIGDPCLKVSIQREKSQSRRSLVNKIISTSVWAPIVTKLFLHFISSD